MPPAPVNPTQPPSVPPPPAWSDSDLASNPHEHAEKQERVRRMFASIAPSYDLNNRLHSFGLDQRWRKFAVRHAGVRGGDRVLDVACGTGDLTRAFAGGVPSPAGVTGLDYTAEMLEIARTKTCTINGVPIDYLQGDAQRLPFEDKRFDVVSIAFGIRNVQSPESAAREFFRVLRPGGRVVILEFDRPRNPLIRWGNDVYTRHIMPRSASLISRDTSGAYKYLPKSVERFLDRDALRGLLTRVGFTEATSTPLTFGVCVCHRAVKV